MRKLKKLSLIVIIALFAFFTISYIRTVNAETSYQTSSELTIDGAAVRTTGKPGIQFVANVNNYDTKDVKLYGMLLAFGRYQATEEFVIDATLGGSEVLKGYKTELRSDNTYRVTVYNFPEDLYLSGMSARPYVELNDGTIVYGESVIYRSLGAVVLKAINSGQSKEGNLLEEVESLITSTESGKGYMKYGIDSFGNFTISNLYEADSTKLRDIFINDYNKFLTSINVENRLSSDTTWAEFNSFTKPYQVNQSGTSLAGSKNTDISTSNLFKFFQQPKMADKWGWILDWFVEKDPSFFITRQVNAINGDGTYIDTVHHSNYISDDCLSDMIHLISSLYSFFYNDQTDHNGSGSIIFGSEESYKNILNYNNSIYADLLCFDVVKIGDELQLPEEFIYVDENGQSVSSIIVDNEGISYKSSVYNIEFIYNDNVVKELEYLPKDDLKFEAYNLDGYAFLGWYDNPEFTGNPVTGLNKGTSGDKKYYAKLYEGTYFIVDSAYTDKKIGDVININCVEYVYGTSVFSSVIDAINSANKVSAGTTLIYIESGTYDYKDGSNTVAIANRNIKIVGPNEGISGNASRNDEAVLNNICITINSNLTNIEFDGLKFTGNSSIINRDKTYGLKIENFKFNNNYVYSSNCISSSYNAKETGFIEFDAVGSYYSTNVEITNNYFEHNLSNLFNSSVEHEMIALDNVCNLNLSNNTFKNIKDVAVHIYDTRKGLSGETNKLNNNVFENVNGNAIIIQHISPTTANGTNNIVKVDDNKFTNVIGTCITFGYENTIGNSSDVYKEISISGNEFNAESENYIYLYEWRDSWTNTFINDNVFNAIPKDYYIYIGDSRTVTVYPKNNEYFDNGEKININTISSKFTDNVEYAPKYSIKYMYNNNEVSSDTYREGLYAYPLLSSYDVANGEFLGWYDNPEFTGIPITEIASGDKGDKVYYARIVLTYTITYMYDGNIVSNLTPNTYKQGDAFELPIYKVSDSSRYVFEGWFTNSNLISGSISAIDSTITGNLVLYAKVSIIKSDYAVDDDWASKTTGATVTLNGKSYIYGTNAFSTIAAAISAVNKLGANANVNINVAAGTYSSAFTISTSGVKLSGPNEGIDGNSTRKTEAVISGLITLSNGLKDIEINGFKFTGNGRIYKADLSSLKGTISSFTSDLVGFTFANNYVNTSDTNGFLQFIETSYNYSKNLVFTNNYFTQSTTSTYYLRLNNCYNVVITENAFKNIKGTAVYIDGGTVGLIGEHTEICNNTFDTVAADAIYIKNIDPICDSGNPAIDFNENTFRSVTGSCIKFDQIKGNANFGNKSYSYISIVNNIFDNSFTNGIYVTTHSAKMNLMISGNIFNVIPSSYYIHLKSTVTVYALGNKYLDGGNSIIPNAANFTDNIVFYGGDRLIGSYETNSWVVKGETIQLNAKYLSGSLDSLAWLSLNTDIATVDEDGKVKGIKEGLAEIVVYSPTSPEVSFAYYVTVLEKTPVGIEKLLVDSNNESVYTINDLIIGAVGVEYTYYTDIIGSVSKLLFEPYKVNKNGYYLSNPSNKSTFTGTGKGNVDFIAFHYAADMPYNVNASKTGGQNLASVNYSYNKNGTSASWHYSVGNDGAWACQSTAYGAWHAGSSKAMTWTNTGVPYSSGDPEFAKVTLGSDNYFYINGIRTTIKNSTSIKKMNGHGLATRVVNGVYQLGGFYGSTKYDGGYICSTGGNNNSIGIESSVRKGSDLWLTWQYAAQLCANLLIEFELPLTRLVGHHFFDGKWCPQPMLENNMEIWWEFVELVRQEMEYFKNYSNYTLTFSSNSNYLDDNGRILSQPEYSQSVTYTIKYTVGSTTKSITLSSIIPGTKA